MGLDAKSLGGASVLVTLHGAGPTGTFTADVSQGDGVLRVDHQGRTSVVKACTR